MASKKVSAGVSKEEIEKIAKVCHAVNLAYCEALVEGSDRPSGAIEWAKAPASQKDSAKAGVEFHLANPKAKASDSHDAWAKARLEQGWKHGPVKDEKAKTHPCLVPYLHLPTEQRAKDHLFKAVVHAMAESAGVK